MVKSWKSGFLRNSFFCAFWVPKNFFEFKKPNLALETPLLGGHTSKTFWSCWPMKVFSNQKLIFSKNLNSMIWLNIGGGSHNGPGHPGTIRPQYTIQKLTKYLAVAQCARCSKSGTIKSFDVPQMFCNMWYRNSIWNFFSLTEHSFCVSKHSKRNMRNTTNKMKFTLQWSYRT